MAEKISHKQTKAMLGYEKARKLILDSKSADFDGAKPETLVAKAESALEL